MSTTTGTCGGMHLEGGMDEMLVILLCRRNNISLYVPTNRPQDVRCAQARANPHATGRAYTVATSGLRLSVILHFTVRALSLPLSRSLSLSHTLLSLRHTLSLSALSHSHSLTPRTHSLACTHTHAHSHTHSHSLTLHSLACTQSLAHSSNLNSHTN